MARRLFVYRRLTTVPEETVDLARSHPRPSLGESRDDQLDSVNGAGADLDLLLRSTLDQLAPLYPLGELTFVAEDSIQAEDVWNEVVGEDRQPVDVVEPTGTAPAEGEREVRGEDLGALVEGNLPPPVV